MKRGSLVMKRMGMKNFTVLQMWFSWRPKRGTCELQDCTAGGQRQGYKFLASSRLLASFPAPIYRPCLIRRPLQNYSIRLLRSLVTLLQTWMFLVLSLRDLCISTLPNLFPEMLMIRSQISKMCLFTSLPTFFMTILFFSPCRNLLDDQTDEINMHTHKK